MSLENCKTLSRVVEVIDLLSVPQPMFNQYFTSTYSSVTHSCELRICRSRWLFKFDRHTILRSKKDLGKSHWHKKFYIKYYNVSGHWVNTAEQEDGQYQYKYMLKNISELLKDSARQIFSWIGSMGEIPLLSAILRALNMQCWAQVMECSLHTVERINMFDDIL